MIQGRQVQCLPRLLAGLLCASLMSDLQAGSPSLGGPLRIHPENRRYFTDGSGRAILLSGSQIWRSVREAAVQLPADPPVAYGQFPQLLEKEQHSNDFLRLKDATGDYLALAAVVSASPHRLAVLASNARQLLVIDRASGDLRHKISLPAEPSGLVVRARTAYVTTNEPAGRLLQIDLDDGAVGRVWRVGHTPMGPVMSSDGGTVYLANRFENRVRSVDLNGRVEPWQDAGGAESADVARWGRERTAGHAGDGQRCADVIREPVAMVLGPDGKHLFVANHLPRVRPFLDDENPTMYAEVSVVDTERMATIRTIPLPNGSQGLRAIALSPDGETVAVTHVLSNFAIPTMRVTGGAMNRNALSLIGTDSFELLATVILDDPNCGAANPWAVCFTEAGQQLVVSHAGSHEISVIDWPSLSVRAMARSRDADLFDEESLTTMTGIRQRVKLPLAGPRALCEVAGTVYVAGYFSDNLVAVDLRSQPPAVREIVREGPATPSPARRGEQYFNDARLCFQQWQSCATCHPDGRADALYWDLLNDGIGNTKNTKSLLMAPLTPPAMSRGVRADAGLAVASGIRHIQFSEPSADQAEAIEQYLLELPAVPSPHLNADVLESPKAEQESCSKCHFPGVPRGTLNDSARRGKAIFEGQAGCSACHPHPYFTSLETVDAGLGTGVKYDVPSLIEAWRTAPYLHHGDGLSLEETITDFNHLQMRGKTGCLSQEELRDLLEYLRSL